MRMNWRRAILLASLACAAALGALGFLGRSGRIRGGTQETKKYDRDLLEVLREGPGEALEGQEKRPGPGRRVLAAEKITVTFDTTGQVLRLDIPEDREWADRPGRAAATIHPSFAAAGVDLKAFVPAAALALKAKRFDDGLYAAVELGSNGGLGRFPSRDTFLRELLGALSVAGGDGGAVEAASFVAAAAWLGGLETNVPELVERRSRAIAKRFLEDPEKLSKPLGFYTWSPALEGTFRRDRLLQEPLAEAPARALAVTIRGSETLRRAHAASLGLNARLTNPWPPGWNDVVTAVAQGSDPRRSPSLFPPSRSHETELVKLMFREGNPPPDFNFADEMIRRIEAGSLDLRPRADSGWYDYQTYALEPLAVPGRMPEAARLELGEEYRRELRGLFKALLALTRETHVKQLEMPAAGYAAPPPLVLRPELTLEPLPTFYVRRALSYRFVRRVLTEAFGPEGLRAMRRLTASGPVPLPLDEELRLLEGLFLGAAAAANDEIGMVGPLPEDLGSGRGPEADRILFRRWARTAGSDPDLAGDVRMMVPLFYDLRLGKFKVWAVLGIARRPLTVSFARPPSVLAVRDEKGAEVDRSGVWVDHKSERHDLPYLVTAEVHVGKLLNRDEFRRLCDRYGTQERILRALE